MGRKYSEQNHQSGIYFKNQINQPLGLALKYNLIIRFKCKTPQTHRKFVKNALWIPRIQRFPLMKKEYVITVEILKKFKIGLINHMRSIEKFGQ